MTPFEIGTDLSASIRIPAAAEIRASIAELAKRLTPLCAAIEEATLPKVDLHQEVARGGEMIGMMTGAFQPDDEARPTTLAQYLEALHIRDQSILAWEQFFEKWDMLLCPPAMVTAFTHCQPGSPLLLDSQEVKLLYDLCAWHNV